MPGTLCTYPINDHELTLRVSPEVFNPTTTTQKIAKHVRIPSGATVLDLGCGVGPLGILAALMGAGCVYAVDIVPAACELARENAERAGVADRVSVHCGDLFEPVGEKRFDVIINDVSGIAERAARLSPWYPPDVPSGGEDGTDHVLRVLSETPDHLNPGGTLYFATSTLSNVPRILEHAKQVFDDRVERLGAYKFPFSPELIDSLDELSALREAGKVDFEARRSRYIWTLEVFSATVS